MEECILAKTLLILGAGPDQLPGIKKANAMGITTIALDGNPDAIGQTSVDYFYPVNIKCYADIEIFVLTQLTHKIDGVIAFGVDIPYIIARTASLLKVNYTITDDVAKMSEDKFLSKEFMNNIDINIPPYQKIKLNHEIDAFIQAHGFPIIIKPVDNSAARGISYVTHKCDIEQAVAEAFTHTKQDHILVEKYLNGPQISTESLVVDGIIHNIGFADRNYADMDRFFPSIIEDGGDLPSLYMSEQYKQILEQQLTTLCHRLAIKNGVIKGDLVIHNNQLFIIEFALRLSGGNFSTIEIPESTGIDFIALAIKLHLNEKVADDELIHTKNEHISLRYKFNEDSQSGIIKEIIFPKQHDAILLQTFHAKRGQIINSKTTDHSKRLGFVIAKGESRELAINNAQQQLKNIRLILD